MTHLPADSVKSQRLISLDIFRGITIAGMILVNNPGSWDYIYPPLRHAEWNGCTPTDLIFPFFLFIVGTAIPFSLGKKIEKNVSLSTIIFGIIKRSVILFLLGLIIYAFPFGLFDSQFELSDIRIPGVLQRIAVVYLVAAILFIKTSVRTQVYTGASFLIIYWILMTQIPVPGIGYSNLEPATNLAAWIDNKLLEGHLWSQSKVWDPEGILSTIPAISTAIMGMITGRWLKSDKDKTNKTVWLFIAGSICITLGYIWNGWFPINKNIWTSSYVLYTGGIALFFLAFCYWFYDVLGKKWWSKPFVVYGSNAISVYFLSEIAGKLFYLINIPAEEGNISLKEYTFNNYFLPLFDPVNASLAWALIYVLFWLGIMWILYSKKIFIKV